MKKIIIGIVISLSLLLSGCKADGITPTNSDKTTPVYQGMELTKHNEDINHTTRLISNVNNSLMLDGNNDVVDEDGILEDATDLFSSFTSVDVSLYAMKNETLFVTVNILNPDSFEILSFSLNGYKYQSYEFEDGSNSEQLILEVNSKDLSGVKEFTIDTIKYVDGSEIKDVLIAGDKTVKLGVEYDTAPSASISNETITPTTVSFNVTLSDELELINATGTTAKAVLYDATNIIDSTDLSVGENNVLFDGLSANKEYQYAVVAGYDLLDSNGAILRVLEGKTFETLNYVELNNVVSSQDTIMFELDVTDPMANGSVTSILLYQGETEVASLSDVSKREFTGLSNNTAYTIKVIYSYNLNDEPEEQVTIDEVDISTLDELSIVSLDIVDTVLSGEPATMEINVYNPSSYEIEHIVVNGEQYSLRPVDELPNTYQFDLNPFLESGAKNIEVEVVTVRLEETEVDIDANYSLQLDVLEYIGLEGITTDVSGDVVLTDSDIEFTIALENSAGYTVTSFVLDGVTYNTGEFNYTVDDELQLNLHLDDTAGYKQFTLESLTIDVVGEEYLLEITSNNTYSVFVSTTTDVNQITSIEDLQQMDLNGVYVLMNDLDLIDYDWQAIGDFTSPFDGYFNGNGYTISNLTFDISESNGEALLLSLFGKVSEQGYINDVRLDNYTVEILNEISSGVYAGGIVAYNYGVIFDSHVTGDILVHTLDGGTSTGGLVARNFGEIHNSSASVHVDTTRTVTQNDMFEFINVGGLVGGNRGIITNSYATGDIYGVSESTSDTYHNLYGIYVGGLAGRNSNIIESSYATGNVTAAHNDLNVYAAGLVGLNESIIKNSFITGTVIVDSGEYGYIGYITNHNQENYPDAIEQNVYVYSESLLILNNVHLTTSTLDYITVEQSELNSVDWYINQLGFSDSIWDLRKVQITDNYPVN